ncbi:hypothetical protein ACHAW6_001109 [Cyclotella cf. meneghiniana]
MRVKRTKHEACASSKTNPSCQRGDIDVEVPLMIKLEPGKLEDFNVKTLKTRFDVDTLRRVDPFMYYSIFKFDHEDDCISSLLQRNSACNGLDLTITVSRRSRLSVERDAVTEMIAFMSELDGVKSWID